jgi:hypothetical protein
MGDERVTQALAACRLGDPRCFNRALHGPLDRRLVEVMPSNFADRTVVIPPRRRKRLLPTPLLRGIGILGS